MKLRDMPVETLRPAPYNPRHELRPGQVRFERLARSIAEFDLVQPLVWNERTGHLVAGHRRLEVARAAGRSTVPAVVVDLSLSREKALNLALNNPAVGSTWDEERLEELLLELRQTPEIDETLTGFDADEIADLVMEPAPLPAEPVKVADDDRVRVTLEVAQEEWESVRRRLDALVGEHHCELHVRLPRGGGKKGDGI